jgi:molybdopterin-guanine dinucleotide biosynthesis protein A
MSNTEPVAGIILAGGRSRRLGRDKRRLKLWGAQGPTLLEQTLHILQPLCAEVLVVLNDPENWPELACPIVPDSYPDGAALGGLYTGLSHIRQEFGLVVAADMPLLNPALLATMIAHPRDYEALLLRSPEPERVRNALAVEPLHAIYQRHCRELIPPLLAAGKRSFHDLLLQLNMCLIEPATLIHYPSLAWNLLNINTAADLEQFTGIMHENHHLP